MSDKPEPSWTKEIKTAYLAGTINFVNAVYELREINHTPDQVQKMVTEWIKEKHNGPRDN